MNRWIRRNYKAFWAIVIALLLTLSTVGFPVYAYATEINDNSQVETVIDNGVKLNGGEDDEVEPIPYVSGTIEGGAGYEIIDNVLIIHEGRITESTYQYNWPCWNNYKNNITKKRSNYRTLFSFIFRNDIIPFIFFANRFYLFYFLQCQFSIFSSFNSFKI